MWSGMIQRFLGGEMVSPQNRVLEIKSDVLGTLQILARDEAMVLFAPPYNERNGKFFYYEIVLQRPTTESTSLSFSLFRSTNQKEAEDRFSTFIHRVPQFVSIVKEFYCVNGLQKVCDKLVEYPSWSIAHLIAYFNLPDYVDNPKILHCIDYKEHINLMTPLQVAIKSGNVDMVKALLHLCNVDDLDANNNNVFHYAASSNKEIIDLLTPLSTSNLNSLNNDGYSPLHLACLSDKPDCVETLLGAGADPNVSVNMCNKHQSSTTVKEFFKGNNNNKLFKQDMKYGGTPLHWCSSRESLYALIASGCNINAKNFLGRTALHVMVAKNYFDCVVSLLAHEAEIDVLDNDGNSALHIAVEKRFVTIVQCLVVFGCNIDIKDKNGFTPRHLVGNESCESAEVLYILHSVGAKRCLDSYINCPPGCNSQGSYNGIPPEVPAGAEKREHIENMLSMNSRQASDYIGANQSESSHIINTDNERKGQSMMDALLAMFTAKGNVDSTKDNNLHDITPKVISLATTLTSNIPDEHSAPNEKYVGRGRLLCLDGGGIRGLLLVQILLEIERLAETPIVHLFDWIAGTSTGGILALGLGSGKTMRQCMSLYIRMKEKCFVGSRPYPSDIFEDILKENLGEFTVMTDIKHPKVMVTAVLADRKPVDLHLFRNYTSASELLGIVTPINNRCEPPPRPEHQLIWQAARATGAAPSYFRAFGRYLDGGLIANNPTLDAMTEIHEFNMALRHVGQEAEAIPVTYVVSLGTGLVPVTELSNIDLCRPERLWDYTKLPSSITTLCNLLVDQATASDGRVVDRARAWCSVMRVPYIRLNPQLSEDIALDEKSDQKLINMLWETKAYMYANLNKILEMIRCLKNTEKN